MNNLQDDLKDTISKVKDEAEKVLKIAIDKTSTAVDVAKLKIAKNEANRKINKLYAKIGEIIYSQYKDGEEFDDDIAEALIGIDKFKAESAELSEQIAALKNSVVCPECGQHNSKTSEYCSKCGAKLSEDAEKADEEGQAIDIVSEEE